MVVQMPVTAIGKWSGAFGINKFRPINSEIEN